MIHYRKRTWLILCGMFVAVFSFTFLTAKYKDNYGAQATSAQSFDPGYIISDQQMGDYTSMSEKEIQAFLTQKNPCDNRDYALYKQQVAKYPNTKWHWDKDHFVCLSEEKFGEGTTIGTGETAAHIIWQAAQDYKINPQVLIVLLEKEQGLVTDELPNSGQYQTATGFGCPDTAKCNAKYYGFKNQVRRAAELFRDVLDGGWSNYPVGKNYIQYNPDPSCGGTIVNVRNRATSALYRYTPYQPNQSALAAGYGKGNACGAYGNRNFYLWFMDWFEGGADLSSSHGTGTSEARTNYERPVSDGVYRLYSKDEPGKAADIYGGAVKNAKMQVYDKKTSGYENQVFEVKYNSADGYYNIINPATGSAFDVRSAAVANNTPIDVFPLNSDCNQDWLFEKDWSGYYTIKSRCSSRVMDVKQGTDDLVIYDDRKTDSQKWKLEKVADVPSTLDGTYRFVPKAYPNEAIDIEGGLAREGSLISYSKKATDFANQTFRVKYDPTDGYYNIINPATGSAIDVQNGEVNKGNLTPVGVFPLHSKCNQDWSFVKDAEGYYTIKSRCSGRVLDIVAETRRAIIFDDHGGNNQKWKLEKVN